MPLQQRSNGPPTALEAVRRLQEVVGGELLARSVGPVRMVQRAGAKLLCIAKLTRTGAGSCRPAASVLKAGNYVVTAICAGSTTLGGGEVGGGEADGAGVRADQAKR